MELRRLFKIHSLIILFLSINSLAFSQYYNSGQDPSSIHWKQINTELLQVVFPEEFEDQAQYFTYILEEAYHKVGISLDSKPKKISILIHNQSVISNGVTAWAPKRVDMFSTPPQDTYPENWFNQLAIHELRHIVQIESLNTGLTKVLSILLGEQATAAILGLFIPPWFLEGDAVCTETEFSKTGRGRLPSFQQSMKAQLLEKGMYSYEKAVHGSYKDFIPNEYAIGYLLTQYGHNKYDSGLWKSALSKSAKMPFTITPFSSSIKKTTGFSKQKYYKHILENIKQDWEKINNRDFIPFEVHTLNPKYFTNYFSPIKTNEGDIIAEKKSIDDVRKFVRIKQNGNEDYIFTPGIRQDNIFSYSKGKLCWAEIEFDSRWDHLNYSVIKLFDTHTKKLTSLTSKTRYFSPSISPDARLVAAIRVTTNNQYYLCILKADDGSLVNEFQTINNEFLISPSWKQDKQKIVLISVNDEGKTLLLFDLKTQNFTKIGEVGYTDITNPFFANDKIYFTGSYSGTTNIFSLDLNNNKTVQITDVPFGADNSFVDIESQELLFMNYTSDGYKIASMNLKDSYNKPLEEISFKENKHLAIHDKKDKGLFQEKIKKKYEVKKYSKLGHLFNIHSWAPASIDADAVEIKPGLSLASQNLLSTAFTTLGYEYDLNNDVGKSFVNFSYEGWYPIIDIEASNGGRRHYYKDTLGVSKDFTYQETNINSTIRLPLSFSKNKYIRGIQPFVKFNNIFLKMNEDSPFSFTQDVVHSLKYSFYAYHQLRSSLRDLYPKWGQVLQLSFSHTPFQDSDISKLSSAIGILFFPGLAPHHGIRVYAGYQKREAGSYDLSADVNHPRGYHNQDDLELFRISVHYKFPLWYPDINIGSLVYIKRLKLAAFYDYAEGRKPDELNIYQSTGLELTSDIHLLSFIAPFDFGCRFIYIPENQSTQFELLFNINFSSLY